MEQKRLYYLARFDAAAEAKLQSLYQRLVQEGFAGTQTRGIPYHITLGDFPAEQEESLLGRMERVCEELRRFPIRLAHIGLFGQSVLFLTPAPSRPLIDLYQALSGETVDGHLTWTPHVTMLIDEPPSIHRALPLLAQWFQPMDVFVEGVSLYEFFPPRLVMAQSLK